jgi:hypothetical protein
VTDLLKFAVIASVVAGVTADPGWMNAFARQVESCGFESIDRVVLAMPPTSDLGEAKDVLSACAQRLTLDA